MALWETHKERRQRTPAVVAMVSGGGFRSETDPAGIGSKEKPPAGTVKTPAGVWTGRMSRIRIVASAPSGLSEPAGRFHRGATRGELESIISGSVEDATT